MHKVRVGMVLSVLAFMIFFLGGCREMNPDSGVKLNPPTQLTAAAGDGQVELKWSATTSTPEAEYHIYQASSSAGPYQMTASTSETSYVVKNLVNGTVYCFRVTASLNNVAESDPSNTVSVKPGINN